jgi:hypothetical protein
MEAPRGRPPPCGKRSSPRDGAKSLPGARASLWFPERVVVAVIGIAAISYIVIALLSCPGRVSDTRRTLRRRGHD